MKLELPSAGRVLNLGTDLVDIARITKARERHGARFLDRIFTPAEQDYCLGMRNPDPHLAARFAAKEAISKGFTTGIGREFGWKTAEVLRDARGAPYVQLDAQGSALLRQAGGSRILISLTHTQEYANAVILILE